MPCERGLAAHVDRRVGGVIRYVIQSDIRMATRTVRLDDEAEAALDQIRRATGLPISEALKRGLRSLREQVKHETNRTLYDSARADRGVSHTRPAEYRFGSASRIHREWRIVGLVS